MLFANSLKLLVFVKAVPFKRVVEERNRRLSERVGKGSNSDLFYHMRLDMIYGRMVGGRI